MPCRIAQPQTPLLKAAHSRDVQLHSHPGLVCSHWESSYTTLGSSCALNMDLMSVPSCCTSLVFISYAAVISRLKYCYWSVIVSCGMFTLGAGVTVPEFGSCWVLVWTHRRFSYLRQLSGTGAVPECTDVTLYLGTKESTGHLYSHRFPRPIHCFGSQ